MSSNDYRIQVVDRAMDVLEALAESDTPMGASEIAREIGATRSAVFRLLVNLEQRRYVQRDHASGNYVLGGRLIWLGHRAQRASNIRTSARPVLEALHTRFNETVNLGVQADGRISYVDMIESDQGLRMAAQIGSTDDIHSTALGKAILSFLPNTELERILNSGLRRLTDRTITNPQLLLAELAEIRKTAIAEDRGENELGARCFGSPIFDHQGNVVAAISVSSPESRLRDDRAWLVSQAVRNAAAEITESIGGVWPLTLSAMNEERSQTRGVN